MSHASAVARSPRRGYQRVLIAVALIVTALIVSACGPSSGSSGHSHKAHASHTPGY